MKASYNELRQSVLDKFDDGYIPDLNDLFTDFERNIKILHAQIISGFKNEKRLSSEEYTLLIQNTFRSTAFKKIFADLSVEDISPSAIGALQPSDKTSKSFLQDGEEIKGKTIDFFVVFSGYENWKSFERNYPNPDIKISEREVIFPEAPQKPEISKPQQLEIPGVKIIDEHFISKIENGTKFSHAEFYTAKQDEDCQWYGILKNYAVNRNDYTTIKPIALNAFKRRRTFKVSAVIYGAGGSGKSTLLRKLAVDLCRESKLMDKEDAFQVIWLNDNSFKDFADKGISAIEDQKNKNFLLIIEDWYRTVENHRQISKFLKKTDSISNIRIIIGDRIKDGKIYLDHLNDSETLFHLDANQNKEIIEQVISNYPEWKGASAQLFAQSYQSTLFLLLFVIARASQEEFKNTKFDLSEPETAFITIVKSDLKSIPEEYKGIAKALHYWACVSIERLSISYETFLKIADYYNKNDKISKSFSELNSDSRIHEKLKIYISVNKKGFLQFNHDILAELGLKKVSFTGWEVFGDIIKTQLLDIITDQGDNYSINSILNHAIWSENSGDPYFRGKKLFHYIEKLIDQDNHDFWNLNILRNISKEEEDYFAEKLWETGRYPHQFFTQYFYSLKGGKLQFWEKRVLQIQDIENVNPQFFISVLVVSNNEEFQQNFVRCVLEYNDTKNLDTKLIQKSLSICTDEELNESFLKRTVIEQEWESNFFHLLLNFHWFMIDHRLKEDIEVKIMLNADYKERDFVSLFCNLMKTATDQNVINIFINRIINDSNPLFIDQRIYLTALKFLKDKNLASFVLKNCAHFISETNCIVKTDLVLQSLLLLENGEPVFSEVVSMAVERIISRYYDSGCTSVTKKFYYSNLMSIRLPFSLSWKEEYSRITQNWEVIEKGILMNILYKHQRFPNDIKWLCQEILSNWKKQIITNDGSLYCIAAAIGHPDLKIKSKTTAFEMLNTEQSIPKYFKEILEQIVCNDIYPEW